MIYIQIGTNLLGVHKKLNPLIRFVGLAYQGKDIVFRFIIEYIVA
jgi:hypothetical protein